MHRLEALIEALFGRSGEAPEGPRRRPRGLGGRMTAKQLAAAAKGYQGDDTLGDPEFCRRRETAL
jgi:hypothetical protein